MGCARLACGFIANSLTHDWLEIPGLSRKLLCLYSIPWVNLVAAVVCRERVYPAIGPERDAVLQFAALRRFAVGPSNQALDRLFGKELFASATVDQVFFTNTVEIVLAACTAHIM